MGGSCSKLGSFVHLNIHVTSWHSRLESLVPKGRLTVTIRGGSLQPQGKKFTCNVFTNFDAFPFLWLLILMTNGHAGDGSFSLKKSSTSWFCHQHHKFTSVYHPHIVINIMLSTTSLQSFYFDPRFQATKSREIRQSNLHILPAYQDMYTSGQCNVKLGRRIIYFKSNQANGDLIFDATDIRFIQCIQNWNIIFSRYRKNEKY